MHTAKRFLSLFRKTRTDPQSENVNQQVENVEKNINWIFNADSASVLRICVENGELVFKVGGVKRKDGKFKISDCTALSEDQYTIIEDDCDRIFILDFNVIDIDLSNTETEENDDENGEDYQRFDILLRRLKQIALKCGVFRIAVKDKHKDRLNDILPLLAFETLHLRNSFYSESLSDLLINPELKENSEKRGRLRCIMLRRKEADGIQDIPGIQKSRSASYYRLDVEGATIYLVCDADGFDVHVVAPNTRPRVTSTGEDGIFN